MLTNYFINPRTIYQMRLGPIGSFMDEISAEIGKNRYSKWTARSLLRGISHFSKYMLWLKVEKLDGLTMNHINDFLKNHLPVCNCERPNTYDFSSERSAMDYLRRFLLRKGIIAEETAVFSPDSIEGVLLRYKEYLTKICALSEKSIYVHELAIRRVLNIRLRLNGNQLQLEKIKAKDVLDTLHVLLALNASMDWKSNITSCTRVFLRFLFWEQIIPEDLGHIVPSVIKWKLQDFPKAINAKQIEALLATPDRSTPTGIRDYSVLILLVTLGVRASEIVALTLDDIHWQRRMLTVPACKSHKKREMPLSDVALDALSDYIYNVRPKCESRCVFLRLKAPIRGFASSSAVTTLVRDNIIKSGIQTPGPKGPHILRHSFATILVNKGVALKEIADLLGHSALNTTKIYTKVDLSSLRKLVTPFPNIKLGR